MSTAIQLAVQQRTEPAYSPVWMAFARVSVDLVTLSVAVLAGFAIWSLINPSISVHHYSKWLAVAFSCVAFGFYGMYPGVGMTAVEQMRDIVRGITFVYLFLNALMFLVKDWRNNSRGGFLLAWALSLVLVPLGRWIAGSLLGSQSWWGTRVMILGAGETGQMVIRNLLSHRVLGYRPVVCLDDDSFTHGTFCEGIPIAGALQDAAHFAREYQTRRAIVAMPGLPRKELLRYLEDWSKIFPKIVIVPDLFGVASLWTKPRDLGGILGLVISCNLLNPTNQFIKRAIDIAVSSFALLGSAPFFAIVILWIRKSSPGPVLYTQEREGRDGRRFKILKLRTMYPDSERRLLQCLSDDPVARDQWERYCKLKNDPRILPGVGNFLRKTSLDELPQLWNILKGEMSLVGPRPFPEYHNSRFDPEFRAIRTQVTPGLTGLWQVSARSDGDLQVQERLDSYYIRNWSLWLDLYILVRTVRTVLARDGAY